MYPGRAQSVEKRWSSYQFEGAVDATGNCLAHFCRDVSVVDEHSLHAEPMQGVRLRGFRVVDSTVMPSRLSNTAVVMPTEEVPPRMRMDCPGWASRPTVSEP